MENSTTVPSYEKVVSDTTQAMLDAFTPKQAVTPEPTPSASPTKVVSPSVVTADKAAQVTQSNINQLSAEEQLKAMKAEADRIQAEIDKNKAAENQTGTNTTSTSGSTDTQITDSKTKDPMQVELDKQYQEIDTYYNQVNKKLNSIKSANDTYFNGLLDSISQTFEQRKEQQKQYNRSYEAGVSVAGMVSGRARYAPELQGSLLHAAESAGLQKLVQLDVQEQAALNEANKARTDSDYQMLNAQMELLKNIRQEKRDVATALYEQVAQQEEAKLKQLEYQMKSRELGKDIINDLALSTSEITTEDLGTVAAYLGVTPDVAANVIDVQREVVQAKNQTEIVKAQQSLINLLQDIPRGQEITFPDGTTYTGIGDASDIFTAMQVDSNGYGTIISYDKLTGAINTAGVGRVGKSSASGGGGTSSGISFSTQQKNQIAASGMSAFSDNTKYMVIDSGLDTIESKGFVDYVTKEIGAGGSAEGANPADDDAMAQLFEKYTAGLSLGLGLGGGSLLNASDISFE